MELFGAAHNGTLLAGAVLCATVIRAGRRGARWPETALAMVILLAQAADPFIAWRYGWLSWTDSLPVELCDAASFLVAAALLTRHQAMFELAYFWGLAGTLQAVLTPDLRVTFPHPEFLRFFLVHIGIVAGVLYLAAGVRMAPRPGAAWRVFGWTLLYAAFVGVLDGALDANYMYLRDKPGGSSPLDWFGPWPWYLVGAAGMALGIFLLLSLPYRWRAAYDEPRGA
jgi:hypothetical integral membrane protein (TIGR02206 family)